MSRAPVFSVVVPVYNVGEILPVFHRLVGSVREQSCSCWELILVNDASTDNTAAVLEEIAAGDNRIRIHTHKSNQRQGMARNSGTAIARGRYVVYCDYDDYLFPAALSVVRGLAGRFNNPDIIQFGLSTLNHDAFNPDRVARMQQQAWWKRSVRYYRGPEVLRQHLYNRILKPSYARAVRTELAQAVGYEKSMPEDIPHSLRLCAQAQSAVVIRQKLYCYICRPESDLNSADKGDVFRNCVRSLVGQCQPLLDHYQTKKRWPRAHRRYRMMWLVMLAFMLSEFEYAEEDLLVWGRIADDTPLNARSVAEYLCHIALHGGTLGGFRLYLLMRRHYSARQRLLRARRNNGGTPIS